MIIRCSNGCNAIHHFSCCLTRLYVVIICDSFIIMDGIWGIQNRFFSILYLTEGADVVVYSMADDIWESKDEITGALGDEFDSCD